MSMQVDIWTVINPLSCNIDNLVNNKIYSHVGKRKQVRAYANCAVFHSGMEHS